MSLYLNSVLVSDIFLTLRNPFEANKRYTKYKLFAILVAIYEITTSLAYGFDWIDDNAWGFL